MGILSSHKIREEIEAERISISPLVLGSIQPASVDLRIRADLVVYAAPIIDAKQQNDVQTIRMPANGYILHPGKVYLGSTVETVHTDHYVTRIEEKSSINRLGISLTGFGDPGFRGVWCMRITVVQPVRIYPVMPFAQIVFEEVSGEIELYSGRYQDQRTALPSLAWMGDER